MKSQDYLMLAQNDRDQDHDGYVVRPEKRKASIGKRLLVVLLVIVLLFGSAAVIAGLFYPEKVNYMINTYIKSDSSGGKNTTESNSSEFNVENNGKLNASLLDSPNNQTEINHSAQDQNIHQQNETSVEDEDETDSTTDADKNGNETEKTEMTPKSASKKPIGNSTNDISVKPPFFTQETLDDAEKTFAGYMIRIEAYLEDITGIRRPELLIPLFMLFCFLVSFAFAACCCSLIMRRKDNQRRKTLGRMITDLETGDTDPILSDHERDD